MGSLTEIDVLKTIDKALSDLKDQEACNRVLAWAWKKFSSDSLAPATNKNNDSSVITPGTMKSKKKVSGTKGKAKIKSKPSLTIVKDLNLKPKGKKSLDEIAEIKKPGSYCEKCTVSAHYLKHVIGLPAITESHVYTCFKHMKWRVPANLSNTLAYTASQYGWLDTNNLLDIKVTTMGENLFEHDLPKKGSKK